MRLNITTNPQTNFIDQNNCTHILNKVDNLKMYIKCGFVTILTHVHDKFHRALVLSGFFFLKIASTFLNSSFFPKPIKRRIAI